MKRLWLILFIIILGSCDERIEYSLITRVIPPEGGIVNPSSGTYKENADLSVTATPDSTYVFSGWSGSVTSNDNPLSLTMDSDKNLTATFVKDLRLLLLNISGDGLIEKRVDGNLVNDSLFVVGQTIELTAVPGEGYEFSGWSGSIISTDNPLTLTMDVNKELSAKFISTMRSLVLNISGEGLVEKRVDGNLVNDSLFVVGQTIELTAVPEIDWVFDKWIYPETSINPISVTISKDTTLQVKFMRYFNYKIPSHDWENYSMPWLDLANIVKILNFDKGDSYNTNAAYADFNFDGYIDIMIQPNVNDGVPVNTFFLINNGDNTFYVDNDFPFTQNASVISSRKTIVGDFNNDGKPDVVRPQGGHDWLGKPHITLSLENGYELRLIDDAPEMQPHTISSGDIDSDGDLDLFFGYGFLINDGLANFSWYYLLERVLNFSENDPSDMGTNYGIWSSEMTDVNNDGFIDLILGGSYKDQEYDEAMDGATIWWGDGSGFYDYNNITILFNHKELDYLEGNNISLSHDYAVNDVDGDGINDIAILSDLKSEGVLYQFIKGIGNREFIDKTNELMTDYIIHNSGNHVWVLLRDINENGLIDIVEGEPVMSVQEHISSTGYRESLHWEWYGSSFVKN